jgi:hypothetical protein
MTKRTTHLVGYSMGLAKDLVAIRLQLSEAKRLSQTPTGGYSDVK